MQLIAMLLTSTIVSSSVDILIFLKLYYMIRIFNNYIILGRYLLHIVMNIRILFLHHKEIKKKIMVQIFQPWIQRRRLEYVKLKRAILGLLRHLNSVHWEGC